MRACDELCEGNGYLLTLGCLHSALEKLSALQPTTAPLYRALSPHAAADVWRGAARGVWTPFSTSRAHPDP